MATLGMDGHEPAEWIARIAGEYLEPAELFDLLRRTEIVRHRGVVIDDREDKDTPPQQRWCIDSARRLEHVRVTVGSSIYSMEHSLEVAHEFGDGGSTLSTTTLSKNGTPVLTALRLTAYMSSSDDEADYEKSAHCVIYVLESDPLAEEVLALVRWTRRPT